MVHIFTLVATSDAYSFCSVHGHVLGLQGQCGDGGMFSMVVKCV